MRRRTTVHALYTVKISVYDPRIFCGDELGPTLQCGTGLYYSVDLRTQSYTEPVPLKLGKLITKYPWIYGYFCSVQLCIHITTHSLTLTSITCLKCKPPIIFDEREPNLTSSADMLCRHCWLGLLTHKTSPRYDL